MRVKDVITGQPQTCTPEAKLREVAELMVGHDEDLDRAMELMREHRVRRLSVVDENENLTGVLSLADVARTRPDKGMARTVESISQPTRSASDLPGD